jgi:energy-coupling factor transporter ATP-binding protein EcfA2
MAGARVSLTGVTKTYRLGDGSRLAAADEVTLAVEAGERVALVGPSGSGKSTLLHLMGAVDVPDEGTITVDDQTIVVAFQGAMVGTLLGDAVALQVRAPDLIAAGCLTLLGVVAVATIGFLGIIEDATSYAALQAVGWRDTSLGGALATQAALIGAVGGVAGGALGIGCGVPDPARDSRLARARGLAETTPGRPHPRRGMTFVAQGGNAPPVSASGRTVTIDQARTRMKRSRDEDDG